jgi:hypothetical protein
MVEESNCSYIAHSSCVEDKVRVSSILEDHIVSEFILSYNCDKLGGRNLFERPTKNPLEGL